MTGLRVALEATFLDWVGLATTALRVDGWSSELKIVEHKDFFLRLKAAGKKVIYCPAFQAKNDRSSNGVEFVGDMKRVYNSYAYYVLRRLRYRKMMRRFFNHWNIFREEYVKLKGNKCLDL